MEAYKKALFMAHIEEMHAVIDRSNVDEAKLGRVFIGVCAAIEGDFIADLDACIYALMDDKRKPRANA